LSFLFVVSHFLHQYVTYIINKQIYMHSIPNEDKQ
jgi:hypothetical protein